MTKKLWKDPTLTFLSKADAIAGLEAMDGTGPGTTYGAPETPAAGTGPDGDPELSDRATPPPRLGPGNP